MALSGLDAVNGQEWLKVIIGLFFQPYLVLAAAILSLNLLVFYFIIPPEEG